MSGDTKLPRNPVSAAIHRQFRHFLAVLHSSDPSVNDTSASSFRGRKKDDQVTSPPDATAPARSTGPSGNSQDKRDEADEHRWAELARRNRLPAFVKRYALRRMDIIAARDTVRYFESRDLADNEETRVPDGERVYAPAIWLTELYTPTTLAGLLDGLPRWFAKSEGIDSNAEGLIEWINGARRRGGGAWRSLPYVFPADSKLFWPGGIIDALPEGIAFAHPSISTLTSTITAVTVTFKLDEEYSRALGPIINEDRSTQTELRPQGGFAIRGVRWQKREAVDAWRARLRDEAARWLAERLPGSFHRLAPGQLPTIEFLLTERQPPWGKLAEGARGKHGWTQLLDLEDFDGYSARIGFDYTNVAFTS